MIDIITKPIAWLYYQKNRLLEHQLGYRLLLPIDKNWVQSMMIADMTQIWKKHGLDARGTNYFTVGALKNGLSTRFDYNSTYYQAWLGGYIVQFSESKEWTIEDHYILAVADQINWLLLYGDRNPLVKVDKKSVEEPIQIKISNYSGTFHKGSIWSNSDVGSTKLSLWSLIQLGVMTNIFNIINPALQLIYKNFIPKTNNNLEPYQKIYLSGYIIILDLDEKTKAVLYANGATYKDRNGKSHDMYNKIDGELLSLIKAIKIYKNSSYDYIS